MHVRKRRCEPGDLHHFSEQQQKRLSLTAFSISADHQTLGWRLMWPKGMKDLAAFSAREVKRVAAEEREKEVYSSAEGP